MCDIVWAPILWVNEGGVARLCAKPFDHTLVGLVWHHTPCYTGLTSVDTTEQNTAQKSWSTKYTFSHVHIGLIGVELNFYQSLAPVSNICHSYISGGASPTNDPLVTHTWHHHHFQQYLPHHFTVFNTSFSTHVSIIHAMCPYQVPRVSQIVSEAAASHVTVTYWDCDPMLTPVVRSPMLPVWPVSWGREGRS